MPKKIVSLSKSGFGDYRVLPQLSSKIKADLYVLYRFDESSGVAEHKGEPDDEREEEAQRRIDALLKSARAIYLEEFLRAGQLRRGYACVIGERGERIEEDEFETLEIDTSGIDSSDVFGNL